MTESKRAIFSMSIIKVVLASAVALGLDRFSKIVVLQWLELASVGKIEVWPPYLNLVMAWNKGVNFGFLDQVDARWLLVAFSLAVSLALAYWARNKPGWVVPLACGAIVGGALGNAYDRVVYGAVADYLNMSCCAISNPYSFNVADVLIFGGAIVLALAHELETRRGKR